MADYKILINNKRAFLPSTNINIFPCSRRGQQKDLSQYDPEARLNTERTNRLHTAINGFKDSFIINTGFEIGETLKFVLAGYYIEAKSFDPAKILGAFAEAGIDTNKIYAHLSLHSGIALSTKDYDTEILYRQSDNEFDKNYLDVSYDGSDFFVGISFTADETAKDTGVTPYFLPLFFKSDNENWELVQTSLLPKIEHDTTEDSIKLNGDFTIKHGDQTSFKVTKDETILGPTKISELTVTEKTTLNGPFNVELEGDTAFKISAGGVTTINTPVRIMKATTVVGMTNLTGASIQGLIVGEKAEGDIYENGIIKAKAGVETPTLEATASIETPLLNVTNEGTAQATIDNATIATASMTTAGIVTANIAKVNATDATITTANIITANIDTADITEADVEEATVTSTLNIHNDEGDAQLNTDKATIANLTAGSIQLEDIGQVPALELAHLTTTDTYQLRFKFGTPITIKEE